MNNIKTKYQPSDFLLRNWGNVTNEKLKRALELNPIVNRRRLYRLKYNKPAPPYSNLNNLKNLRKLPKRVYPRQNVRHGIPKYVENLTGRRQTKGTCWFYAILNGWLFSYYGRKILINRFNSFTQSSNFRALTKNQLACPSRKHLSQSYFWSYVYHMLRPTNWNTPFHMNVMRGIEFPEGKLIRSSGMRSENQNVTGGSVSDVMTFNHVLFNGQQNKVVTLRRFDNPDFPIPIGLNGAVLSHVYITGGNVHGNGRAHAIAGYINVNKKPMIYDSNKSRAVHLDWIKHPQLIVDYFKENYPHLNSGKITMIATYLKPYKGLNLPPPETRKFNRSKYDPNVYYRYTFNNYIKFFKNMYVPQNFENENRYMKLSNPNTNKNRLNMHRYVTATKNFNRPILRRKYREKFGVHAPGNMSNENLRRAITTHTWGGKKRPRSAINL